MGKASPAGGVDAVSSEVDEDLKRIISEGRIVVLARLEI